MIYLQNKYTRWYCLMICKAQQRLSTVEYTERHHILPRSLGGTNVKLNIVSLTAREHYIAHLLLSKMTTADARHKMLLALMRMTSDFRKKDQRYNPPSRQIALARANFAKAQQAKMLSLPDAQRKAFGQQQKGIPHTIEARQKISDGNKGKRLSTETKELMRQAKLGKTSSAETKLKISITSTGRKLSDEVKQKISESGKGKVLSAETRAKMSAAKRGVKPSDAARQKMSIAKIGSTQSAETKKLRSQSMLERYQVMSDEERLENAKRISEAKKGRSNGSEGKVRSEETKRKMSEARKAYWAKRRGLNQS